MGARLGQEMTSSKTGNKRQTTWLAKTHFLFKPDLTRVRCSSSLRHQTEQPGLDLGLRLGQWTVFRSHRDTIRRCWGQRRVCRRRLCIASFLRRSLMFWCSRLILCGLWTRISLGSSSGSVTSSMTFCLRRSKFNCSCPHVLRVDPCTLHSTFPSFFSLTLFIQLLIYHQYIFKYTGIFGYHTNTNTYTKYTVSSF